MIGLETLFRSDCDVTPYNLKCSPSQSLHKHVSPSQYSPRHIHTITVLTQTFLRHLVHTQMLTSLQYSHKKVHPFKVLTKICSPPPRSGTHKHFYTTTVIKHVHPITVFTQTCSPYRSTHQHVHPITILTQTFLHHHSVYMSKNIDCQ